MQKQHGTKGIRIDWRSLRTRGTAATPAPAAAAPATAGMPLTGEPGGATPAASVSEEAPRA